MMDARRRTDAAQRRPSEDGPVLGWEPYYAEVQSAYDRAARDYDATVGRTMVSRRAKDLAVQVVAAATPPGGAILDVGCYTGTEALVLARRGFRMVGVDLSPAMVELSRAKARSARLEDRARFEVARASDLSPLVRAQLGPFDTAYSVYGTLNLEPQLDGVRNTLRALLKPGGTFVVGLLNPIVLYELLLDPLLGRFQGYRKLAKTGVRVPLGSSSANVEAFLYTPEELAKLLAPDFAMTRVLGLHFLYPPPRGHSDQREGAWWLARVLDLVEQPLQERPFFSRLGRFALIVFRRT